LDEVSTHPFGHFCELIDILKELTDITWNLLHTSEYFDIDERYFMIII
jgi:hypothetical protein